MEIFSSSESYKLYQGNMLDMLDVIESNSIDAIVTDPPYELNFMNKNWDNSGIAFQKETWEKCLKVLKPGGYLIAFGGSRTHHRIMCAIEDAGFEIRDMICWIFGSGFPKSMNIGLAIDKKNGVESKVIGTYMEHDIRNNNYANNDVSTKMFEREIKQAQNEWAGWGTALKPAYEPVIVARKPCEGSCVDNVMRYGVGGLNIDGCRIGTDERTYNGMSSNQPEGAGVFRDDNWKPKDIEVTVNGRFPSNVILTYDDTDFQEVCGGMPDTKSVIRASEDSNRPNDIFAINRSGITPRGHDDEGSAARYYYCAKASKRDRDEGLGKEFDSLELILYCCDGGTEIWKDTITTKEVNPAVRLTDMAASIEKAIAEFGTQPKNDIGLNMLLFGNSILAKFLTENKSITKMGISSITASKILNLLMPYTTKDCIQGANCEMEYGLSLVESAVSSNLLTITIQEKMASVRGAKPVVFKMRYKINEREKHSTHPTVKPTDLMQYLVRLVTPPNGTVLDPLTVLVLLVKLLCMKTKIVMPDINT